MNLVDLTIIAFYWIDHVTKNPGKRLIDLLTSYDIYIDENGFSKAKIHKEIQPLSFVIIT